MLNEFQLIQKIACQFPPAKAPLKMGMGDDASVYSLGDGRALLVSTDAFVEGVHFRKEWSSMKQAGMKAATGAINDLYAMGGKADLLFCAIAVPKKMKTVEVVNFYKGIKKVADLCGVQVAGGDTVKAADHFFAATLTVTGVVPEQTVKLRSAAQVGDVVYVTRPIGLSQAGLLWLQRGVLRGTGAVGAALRTHRTPLPSTVGANLGKIASVHAMIDISDGLSSELWHLAKSSAVRTEIDIEPLRNTALLSNAKALNVDPVNLLLSSGEEYALLFTASQNAILPEPVLAIGKVTSGKPGVYLQNGKTISRLIPTGYTHKD